MKSLFAYFSRLVISPIVNLFIESVEGKENIPQEGGFIIASNHINGLDHFFVGVILKERLEDVRFIGAMDSVKILLQSGLLYYFSDTIVINRRKADRKTFLKKTIDCLRNGNILVIYPEGDSNPTPKLLKGKTGIAEIVFKTGAPVVPVGLIIKNYFKRVIKIGKPLYFLEERSLSKEIENDQERYRLLMRQITDKIMKGISKLCNKPYVY